MRRAGYPARRSAWKGDLVTDGTIVYAVEALDAGEYFFDCSVHPDLSGTLIVER